MWIGEDSDVAPKMGHRRMNLAYHTKKAVEAREKSELVRTESESILTGWNAAQQTLHRIAKSG